MKKSYRDVLILTSIIIMFGVGYKLFYIFMPKRYSISHRTNVVYSRTGTSIYAEFEYSGKSYVVQSLAHRDSNGSYERYKTNRYLIEFLENYPSTGKVIIESIVPDDLVVPYNGWDTIPPAVVGL
ncbi:hypothetical protein Fleli_0494 [Bernardetia litoralis DSM 6794]|uniref:Uncharacterized protein n=1 Tax=Bernardetia litoralis (strain ATCC 23117 / DSM 6794 / NBRC 15988 / NCIMB 1366 / Fx l1 / Sio-4) TaxID=880071 RepID=I4AG84_BERLS|nr:hypothetical protein [Bernardetia litoralis]AFM02969.1 hypothetical protein Fleli_0494 [Bernardetia litoralis DSM 6794]